ncbi:MAG: hypothetical protein NT046_04015 [Arenimonas sp.]|nr:hypothetical protein [Arenimonas sp.]
MGLSFVQSLIAPVLAVLTAQRRLSLATLDSLRHRFRWLRGGRALAPVMFELALPTPRGGQAMVFQVPAALLLPPTQLSLGRGLVRWTWSLERVVRGAGDSAAGGHALQGRVLPPSRRGSPLTVRIEMTVRRAAAPEGLRRLQDSFATAGRVRPRGRPS